MKDQKIKTCQTWTLLASRAERRILINQKSNKTFLRGLVIVLNDLPEKTFLGSEEMLIITLCGGTDDKTKQTISGILKEYVQKGWLWKGKKEFADNEAMKTAVFKQIEIVGESMKKF